MSTPQDFRKEHARLRLAVRDEASEWLREQWHEKTRECPICHTDDWGVYEPVAFDPLGVAPFAGATFPAVPISCSKCGYMVFLNVLTTGVLERAALAIGEDPAFTSPRDSTEVVGEGAS